MSESLSVSRTGRYEARGKDGLVTVPSEATRQREEWNLNNKAQKPRREAAGLNENEHICSVVSVTSSNGVKECVEPVPLWRRQYHASPNPAKMHGHSGVSVPACGEGYSREDGRPHISPERGMQHMVVKNPTAGFYHILYSPEVNPAINGSEMPDNGLWGVRHAHSRNEIPVMGTDTKGHDFCERFPSSSGLSELPEHKRNGIEHERQR